ncbi:hypothetical protein [Flaviaesturariibacter aridisoli]|uniref:Uncharacterized protein n=1 Tax=Flaviaesturariibacter aridisoli TaxID=2545761 RepID=A0A4R4DR40_9BACT|nr:hypothetical protein [Flaviaesturariibacter aridisoli]TCZ63458.1 hypothetical protein E0486_18495 [Flaviaesturariibacter aridisoli]
MQSVENTFKLLFNDEKTTDERKAAFARDMVARLLRPRREPFTSLARKIEGPLAVLEGEIGQGDSSLQRQKSHTRNAHSFLDRFRDGLAADELAIAGALGGYDSNGYREFFPGGGISEYKDAPLSEVPRLFLRLSAAAQEYSAQLPAALVQRYSAYPDQWKALSETSSQSRKDRKEDQNDVSDARRAVDLACHVAGHGVAMEYPGDVERCKEFANIHLLLPAQTHSLTPSGREGE